MQINTLKPNQIILLPVGMLIKHKTKRVRVKLGENRFMVGEKNTRSVQLTHKGQNGYSVPVKTEVEIWTPEPPYQFTRFRMA